MDTQTVVNIILAFMVAFGAQKTIATIRKHSDPDKMAGEMQDELSKK